MKKKFILSILLLILFVPNVKAITWDIEVENYSETYKKWLTLSDDLKKIIPEPEKQVDIFKEKNTIRAYSDNIPVLTSEDNTKYDLRDINGVSYVTPVKNQSEKGRAGLCWAYAADAVIETSLLLNNYEERNFAPAHNANALTYDFSDISNPYGIIDLETGGIFNESLKYITSWLGPVENFEGNGLTLTSAEKTLISTNKYNLKSSYSLPIPSTNIPSIDYINMVKNEIKNNGAIYFHGAAPKDYVGKTVDLEDGRKYECRDVYNNSTFSVFTDSYYDYTCAPHAMAIIGWDDNFSAENFNADSNGNIPSISGAWIVKNSYGDGCYDLTNGIIEAKEVFIALDEEDEYNEIADVTDEMAIRYLEYLGFIVNLEENTYCTGSGGYAYYSYADVNIYRGMYVIDSATINNNNYIYQYNPTSLYNGQYTNSYGGVNIYHKHQEREILNEVAFFVNKVVDNNKDINYKIYVNANDGNLNIEKFDLIKQGVLNKSIKGYYSIKLDEPVELIGDKFAVMIQLENAYLQVSGKDNDNFENLEMLGIVPNVSYTINNESLNDFTDVGLESGVLQIKAFTTTDSNSKLSQSQTIIDINSINQNSEKQTIAIKSMTTNIPSSTILDYKIKNSTGNDVTENFEIEKGLVINDTSFSVLSFDSNLEQDLYTIETIYNNKILDIDELALGKKIVVDSSKLNDNIIYDKIGGNISIPITSYNLTDNKLNIEIKNESNEIQNFNYTGNILTNSNTMLNITIPQDTLFGKYTIRIYNNEVEETVNFIIHDFIEVEDIIFKYEDEKLDEIILLKEDSILVEGIITNDSTLTDIKYHIENSTDKQVASLTNDNQLYGNDTGTVNLVAKVGDQQFKIPITVIDVPNITYDKITYTSNVSGNNKVDNYFGGIIEIEKTTTNKTDSMMSGGMGNVLGSCISYNYDIENKVIINISGSCGLTGGESLRLDAGNYTYEEKIYVFDTKRTVKEFNVDYEIVEYISLESITTNIEKLNLKINNTYDLSNNINLTFGPNDATNKNIKYVGYDEEIININNEGIITALKAGITTIKVMSVYNEEIYDTINVMVNPNIKEIKSSIQSNYNNKLYYGYGGEVTANITTENIIDNERLTIKYYKDDVEQNDMTSIFDTTNRLISNNSTSIDLYVGRDQAIGTYKIELCYEKAECKSFEFEVIEPKKVTSIEANDIIISNDGSLSNINYEIKPSDAFNQNVELKVADTSIAQVEDGKIKGLKEGNTTLTIKALDGSNISKNVNVSVVEKSIVIDNIELENDILYETIGGKLSFRISLINIDSTNVDLAISDENNNIIHEENVTLNDKGYKDIEYDISKELKAGTYKIKVTDGNFEKNATFQVTSYKPVENIKFMYNQKELSNLVLLNEDEIAITSVITNEDATFKEISYSIKDTTIARITNEGLIYGIKVGKTELIASVGFQTFTLPIEITNDSGVEYSSLNIYSNVNGNNTIDNHYGGKYTIEATFDDINTNKEITLKNISLKNSSISQFGTFAFKANEIKNNKSLLEVTFTEYQSIPGLSSGIFNASGGTYIVSYNYSINDTKESVLTDSFEIELKDFVELAKINLTKTEIKLDVNESINVNNLISFEPNNVTNKNVNYDVSNSNVLKLNGITITGLSEGTSTVTITSEENENVKAIINVTVEKNDFLEFSNKVNIHTQSESKYLKGMLTKSTYNDLMTNISTNLDVVLKKADGKIVNEDSELIGTGMKLHVGNNSYDIVIKGDVSGDGKMTVTDVSQLIRHIAKVQGKTKTGAYKIAGDMNDSNTITVTDLSQMIKKIAGVK